VATNDKITPMVALIDVKRSFRAPGKKKIDALVLSGLRVERGARLVVTGANGSGKTTLLHLISGLLRPDSGHVVVDGQPLDQLKEPRLDRFRARTIGILLQGSGLLESLTAEENVMAAMLFAGRWPRREQRERAEELLGRFGVDHRARHLPAAMSGGERQRVALARALANDPPLILADEPTASLDTPSAKRLTAELVSFCGEEGRTLIAATHHPDLFGPGAEEFRLEAPGQKREDAS
jgi:putative ABC transport system ATP-binding protein